MKKSLLQFLLLLALTVRVLAETTGAGDGSDESHSAASVLVSLLPWIVLLTTFGLLVMLLVWIRASLKRYAEHTKRIEDLMERIANALEQRNKNDSTRRDYAAQRYA